MATPNCGELKFASNHDPTNNEPHYRLRAILARLIKMFSFPQKVVGFQFSANIEFHRDNNLVRYCCNGINF